MKREHLAFLFGGFAFGMLVGYGVFAAVERQPDLVAAASPTAAGPQGPKAPSQGGGAPMMVEINALKSRLQGDPNDFPALTRLANLYHEAGIWEQAAGYYTRALEVRPDDPNLLTDLGICYRGLGKFEDALSSFDRANEIDSSHWQSMFNKVIVAAYDLQQFELAIEALQRIEAIDPPPADLDQTRLAELRDALERARSQGGDAEGAG